MMAVKESTIAQAIEQVAADLDLSSVELAAALALTGDELTAWRTNEAAPSLDGRARLERLVLLARHLQETFVPNDVPLWLRQPSRYLRGERPIDALRRGRLDLVEGALEVIEAGVYQ